MISWTDSLEIAISLEDTHPHIDPITINFVELRELVIALEDFQEGEHTVWREDIRSHSNVLD